MGVDVTTDPNVPYAPGWLSPVDIARKVCAPGYSPLTDWRGVTVTAMLLAEAGGNPRAVGKPVQVHVWGVPRWGIALGLGQLLTAVHVDNEAFPGWPRMTVDACFNADDNWARCWAVMMTNRPDSFLYNLTPWSAYTNIDPATGDKVYKAHVPIALQAVRALGGTI